MLLMLTTAFAQPKEPTEPTTADTGTVEQISKDIDQIEVRLDKQIDDVDRLISGMKALAQATNEVPVGPLPSMILELRCQDPLVRAIHPAECQLQTIHKCSDPVHAAKHAAECRTVNIPQPMRMPGPPSPVISAPVP